jgi:hypothetical protein
MIRAVNTRYSEHNIKTYVKVPNKAHTKDNPVLKKSYSGTTPGTAEQQVRINGMRN